MTTPARATAAEVDARAIEELVRVLIKGQRALQMYLPNNPVYQKAMEQVADGFAPAWGLTGRLILDIEEDAIQWEGVTVYKQQAKGEGFAWQLYKDGLRRLTLLPGVESEEIVRFLHVLNRARLLPADAGDDLLTLLWEQEFVLVAYAFVEVLGEGGGEFMQEMPLRDVEPMPDVAREEVLGGYQSAQGAGTEAQARETPVGLPPGVVDLGEYDSTPYFLDDPEIRNIRSDLEEEYRRDIREAAIDALLDIFEVQREATVRHEVVMLLEEILPTQLSTGGFRAVARILRELRVISARAQGLDEELHRAVLSFEERLSQPEILEQLFRLLEDTAQRPTDEDLGEVLRELKPSALPFVLGQIGRMVDPQVRRVLEHTVESLAKDQPQAIATLLESGPPDAVIPSIDLVARLKFAQHLPLLIHHLEAGDEPTQLAVIRALGAFSAPAASTALQAALEDQSRAIRQAALTVLLQRTGGAAAESSLHRVEGLLFDGKDHGWERTERRMMFEAFGQLAGVNAIPRLLALLEPRGILRRREPAEIRACALFALGKVRTFEARLIVDRFTSDKEPVVRSAAHAVLREWIP